LKSLWIARHGETEWTLSRRHTSITDLDLTETGARQSVALQKRLSNERFETVLTSPALRAVRTAKLAGFPDARPVDDLVEYRYGEYEGLTTKEIKDERPDWDLWRDGCPEGESTEEVAARAARVLKVVLAVSGSVLIFGHGHMSRVLTTRYLGLSAEWGAHFVFSTAAVSTLGYEHERPAILLWNDTAHLRV
jgi:probable phosphoglycerate mutase